MLTNLLTPNCLTCKHLKKTNIINSKPLKTVNQCTKFAFITINNNKAEMYLHTCENARKTFKLCGPLGESYEFKEDVNVVKEDVKVVNVVVNVVNEDVNVLN